MNFEIYYRTKIYMTNSHFAHRFDSIMISKKVLFIIVIINEVRDFSINYEIIIFFIHKKGSLCRTYCIIWKIRYDSREK